MAAIAAYFLERRQKRLALLILMLFETYARPSSLMRVQGQHLLAPDPMARSRWWCVLLYPFELKVPGKTNEYDSSVAMDLPRHRKYDVLLADLKSKTDPNERLWDTTYVELRDKFMEAFAHLQLEALHPSLYMLRHGGASHDILEGVRDLRSVQTRGHWRAFQSMRRYEKHARLAFEVQKLSLPVRLHCQALEMSLFQKLAASSL